MRRIIAFVVIVFSTFMFINLTSCSKEPEDLLIGRWELDYATSQLDGYTYDISSTMRDLALEFTAEGTWESANGDVVRKGSWTMASDVLTLQSDGETEVFHVDNLEKRSMTLSTTEMADGIESKMTLVLKK